MKISKLFKVKDFKSNKRARVLWLGAPGVGKTSLIDDVIGKCHGICKKYQPTIWDSRESRISYNGSVLNATFIEAGGFFVLGDMMRVSVDNADIFVLVYSVEDPRSKDFIPQAMQAISEIKGQHTNSLPILIVGNKLDTIKTSQGIDIYDNGTNGAFDKDRKLYQWSKNQVKVSHRCQINTDIIKEGIFFLQEKYL